MGRTYAAVFPDPVTAHAHRSFPRSARGMAAACGGWVSSHRTNKHPLFGVLLKDSNSRSFFIVFEAMLYLYRSRMSEAE